MKRIIIPLLALNINVAYVMHAYSQDFITVSASSIGPGTSFNGQFIKLTSGTLNYSYSCAGTCYTLIEGNVDSRVGFYSNVAINSGSTLRISIDNLTRYIQNGGTLVLYGSGTFNEDLGNFRNTGSLSINANKLYGNIINEGTLTLLGGLLVYPDEISGTGSTIIDGNVTTYMPINNNIIINAGKTLTVSSNAWQFSDYDEMTIPTNITNNGTLVIDKKILTDNLSAYKSLGGEVVFQNILSNANYIDQDYTNNSTLVLTDGTLNYIVSGNGETYIDGDVISNVNMSQDTTIKSGKSLTVSVNNIKNTNLTNNGTLWFNDGTLDKALSNYALAGSYVGIKTNGSLFTNADYINRDFINNGDLYLTGGTSIGSISGTGDITIISNTEIKNNVAANIVSISNNKHLAFSASQDESTYGHFTNNPTMNLTNGTFDIANGYTEEITLTRLISNGNNNIVKIDLDINGKTADYLNISTISGQINLAVKALSNLDIDDTVIWFAHTINNAQDDTFVLSDSYIENLSYDLNIVFDSTNKKWGLQKKQQNNQNNGSENSGSENTGNENSGNQNNQNNSENQNAGSGNSENTGNENEQNNQNNNSENSGSENTGNENSENQNNQNNSENSDTSSDDTNTELDDRNGEAEQSIQPVISALSTEIVQTANYAAKTLTNTVHKLTNSMQKRVGELQWLLKNDDTEIDLNNAFWTRGIHKNFDMNHTSVGLSGLEFGYDRIISSSNNYKWYIGGLGYISGGDSKFKDNKFDISGYGLGAYVMMLEKSGWFTDLVFRQHFINMETSDVKSDYTASSLNLEVGKEFVFGTNTDELKWFMKPSIEGTYISISGTDIGSFKVQDSTSSMISLSVLVGPRWDFTSGRKFQVYGKFGYTSDNSDDVDVVINGVNTKHKVTTNTAELGIGFDYRNSDNSTNVYLETSYITGTDYSEFSGILGLRYAF